MKLLIIAFTCRPGMGSEPGMAFGWVRMLARRHDVTVVVGSDEDRAAIEAWMRADDSAPRLQLHVLALPTTRIERALRRWPVLFFLGIRLWHRRAGRLVRSLLANAPFDFVHLLAPHTFREPGELAALPVPLVWGPLGGINNMPWAFLRNGDAWTLLQEGLRNVANTAQRRWSRRIRKGLESAAVVMCSNRESTDLLREAHPMARLVTVLDIGIDVPAAPSPAHAGRTLRLGWSGRLVPCKALDLALRALAALPERSSIELEILGDGPMRARWQRLAGELGIADVCRWRGRLPHAEALHVMASWDAMVFTSLRDASGTVLIEALSRGVPIIGLDHQGCGDVMTDRCAIKIGVETPAQVVRDLAAAFDRLRSQHDELSRLQSGARARALELDWTSKLDMVDALLSEARGGRRKP